MISRQCCVSYVSQSVRSYALRYQGVFVSCVNCLTQQDLGTYTSWLCTTGTCSNAIRLQQVPSLRIQRVSFRQRETQSAQLARAMPPSPSNQDRCILSCSDHSAATPGSGEAPKPPRQDTSISRLILILRTPSEPGSDHPSLGSDSRTCRPCLLQIAAIMVPLCRTGLQAFMQMMQMASLQLMTSLRMGQKMCRFLSQSHGTNVGFPPAQIGVCLCA